MNTRGDANRGELFSDTDPKPFRILALYDQLVDIDDSPVVALNRAVAVAQVHGPRAGIEALESIQDHPLLQSYYLLYAVRAEYEAQVDDPIAAARDLRRALELAELKSEQSFLLQRLKEYEKAG